MILGYVKMYQTITANMNFKTFAKKSVAKKSVKKVSGHRVLALVA